MWDLIPWPGIKLRPPNAGAWSPSHWTTRSPRFYFFLSSETDFSKRRKTFGSTILNSNPSTGVTCDLCRFFQPAGGVELPRLTRCLEKQMRTSAELPGIRSGTWFSLHYPPASGRLCIYGGFPVFTFIWRKELTILLETAPVVAHENLNNI